MRSNDNKTTVAVSYHQACQHGEPLKENIAFQRCCDDVESGHIFPEKRSGASQPQSFIEEHGHEAVGTPCKQQTGRKRNVSFSLESSEVILIDHQTAGVEHELWYSQSDFMFFEDQAWLCSQSILQENVADRGSFDDMGLVLGLEKMLLCESYLARRYALRDAVMDEQAIQSLAKEIRRRRGRKEKGCCESDGGAEENGIIRLAATSERNSYWARDRAFMAALALEHDLTHTCRAEEDLFDDDAALIR